MLPGDGGLTYATVVLVRLPYAQHSLELFFAAKVGSQNGRQKSQGCGSVKTYVILMSYLVWRSWRMALLVLPAYMRMISSLCFSISDGPICLRLREDDV